MNMRKKIPYLVLLLFTAFGCFPTTFPEIKSVLGGDWVGTISIPDLNQSEMLSFTINSQSGSDFEGTFETSNNRFGPIIGSLNGSAISATMTFKDLCEGSAQVLGTLSNDKKSISGNGNANDCKGGYSFTFTVAKQ